MAVPVLNAGSTARQEEEKTPKTHLGSWVPGVTSTFEARPHRQDK